MLRRFVMFAVAAAFIWPGAAVAQEDMAEETQPMLMISSWKCDFGDVEAIGADWEAMGVAAAQAAIDAGHWQGAGVFYHDWADEWNVNFWAVGENEAHLMEGQDASNDAYAAAAGDAALNLWDHCSEHRDSFYQLGPGTEGSAEQENESNDSMAVSSWKCTDVGTVYEGWMDYTLAKAQAVVDAGQWDDAGVFFHTWGSEWNVNFYYIADDIPSILAGWDTFIGSMDDDAPDLTEVCSDHKDGFYAFGTSAEGPGGEEG